MESKSAAKIIGLLVIIFMMALIMRDNSDNKIILSRLDSLENDQKQISAKLVGLEELKGELNNQLSELRSAHNSKEVQESSNIKNEPIIPATLMGDSSLLNSTYSGDNASPILMMAFLDYQCSPCKQFYKKTFTRLKTEYINKKKIKFIFCDFPLTSNVNSTSAAKFARCAGEQGFYWEAFNALFEQSDNVDLGRFSEIAATIKNIQIKKFNDCFEDPSRYYSEITKESEDARKLGVKGAPAFFISENTINSPKINGILIRGAQPFQVIKHQIENLLYSQRTKL